jgi:hypothetical protein
MVGSSTKPNELHSKTLFRIQGLARFPSSTLAELQFFSENRNFNSKV